jgi:ferredoxin
MATITLKSPDGSTDTFECDEDTIILEALEEAGLDHNSSCRAGACSACAMKLESGTVNQEEQSFLDDEQMDEGYVLTCVAYPTSDEITLLSDQEENVL